MILCNFSNTDYQMDWYGDKGLKTFLRRHEIDGIELFLHGRYEVAPSLRGLVEGVHLSYYPTWLDFYLGRQGYKEDFPSHQDLVWAYGGDNPQVLIDNYKKEYALSKALDANYMVFHVGHVKIKDVFETKFAYSNSQVLEATALLVNEIFQDQSPVTLLFENLWWPGLTLTDKRALDDFMDKIKYENKGIMLDLSHLLLTKPGLKTYEEGLAYILEILEGLGDSKGYIQGIHINYTECHDYLMSLAYETNKKDKRVYDHVLALDRHLVYDHDSLRTIISAVDPKYKVIEAKGSDQESWENNVVAQRFYL